MPFFLRPIIGYCESFKLTTSRHSLKWIRGPLVTRWSGSLNFRTTPEPSPLAGTRAKLLIPLGSTVGLKMDGNVHRDFELLQVAALAQK